MPGPPLGAVIVLGTMPAISSICGCSSPAGRLWIQGAMYAGICGSIGSLSKPGLMDWRSWVVPGKKAPSPVSSNVAPISNGSKLAITHESRGRVARLEVLTADVLQGQRRQRERPAEGVVAAAADVVGDRPDARCCRRPGRRRRSCSAARRSGRPTGWQGRRTPRNCGVRPPPRPGPLPRRLPPPGSGPQRSWTSRRAPAPEGGRRRTSRESVGSGTAGGVGILELGIVLQQAVGDVDAVVGLLGAEVAEHALGAPGEGIRADPDRLSDAVRDLRVPVRSRDSGPRPDSGQAPPSGWRRRRCRTRRAHPGRIRRTTACRIVGIRVTVPASCRSTPRRPAGRGSSVGNRTAWSPGSPTPCPACGLASKNRSAGV